MQANSTALNLRRVLAGLCAVTFLALLVLMAVKVLWVGTLFDKPGEQTWPAAANLYVAHRIQHGGVLYGDWRERPHVPSWYGPATYLPVAYIGRWVDADEHGLYMIGRWISLLATLGTAGLIFWMVRRGHGAPAAFALMMAVVFLTADKVLARFDMSFRADMPACFFTLLGLALVTHSTRPAYQYGSSAAFLVAYLYKQSFIIGPVAVVAWLWLSGNRRHAIRYGGIAAAIVAGIMGLSEIWTDGRFSLNSVHALRGGTTLRAIPFMLAEIAFPAIVPLTVGLYVLTTEWLSAKWRAVTIAFAVSTLLAAATTYRDGSGVCYYLLPLATGCVLCGRQLSSWWQQRTATPSALAGLTIVMALAAVRYVPDAALRLAELPARWQGFKHRHEQHREMLRFIRSLSDYLNTLPGPVLSQFNDVTLYCPRSILIDTFTLTSMADAGAFDDRELIEQIRQKQVAAIVLDPVTPTKYQSTDFFSRRWREAMAGRYRLARRFKWAEIYLPIRAPVGSEPPSTLPPG